jgi:hypothetical protein
MMMMAGFNFKSKRVEFLKTDGTNKSDDESPIVLRCGLGQTSIKSAV